MEREEAIKKVRQMSLPKETMEILEALAPELKESEDERIRKELLDAVDKARVFDIDKDVADRWTAWLEKQKEITPADGWEYADKRMSHPLYLEGFEAGRAVERELSEFEKQKEPVPIPDKFSGLKSLMLQYLQSAANRKDDAEIEDDTDLWGRKILDYVWKQDEKQKEQKPVEKISVSEELYEHIRNACACIEDAMSSDTLCDMTDYLEMADSSAKKAFDMVESSVVKQPADCIEDSLSSELDEMAEKAALQAYPVKKEDDPMGANYPPIDVNENERWAYEEGFKAGRESGLRDGQKYVLNNLDSYGLCKPAMFQWTGKNLKEVIDFTGKSPKFGEWFKSWEDFENYVHSHDDILKLFCEDGSHYEVPVGAWIVKTPDGYNIPSRFRFIRKPAEWSECEFPQDIEKDAVQFCFDIGLNVTPYQAKQIASHYLIIGHNEGYIEGRKNAHIPAKELGLPSSMDYKQEWSEEDKRKLNRIYEILGWAMDEHAFSSCKKLIGDKEGVGLQDFLRSIAKPKQEWSEEDSKRYISIATTLETSAVLSKEDYDANISWLRNLVYSQKYLRPQPHWKPSEVQMKALKAAMETYDGFEEYDTMKSLYEDLKKLMLNL